MSENLRRHAADVTGTGHHVLFAWSDPSDSRRNGPSLSPLRERRKLASLLATDIRNHVVRAGWPVGALLGSEYALSERYCVSRSVVREAARLLEHQGVASMRRGPDGGLVTDEPSARIVADAIGIIFDYSGVTLSELVEAQALLGCWAARTAATIVSDDGVERLEAALASHGQLETASVFSKRHDGVHVAIAWETNNPVIAMFVAAVDSLLARYAPVAAQQLEGDQDVTADSIAHAHDAIVSAIAKRDPDRADRYMGRHVSAIADFLATTGGARQGWTDIEIGRATATGHADERKLAEIVAERVKDDIVAGGWEVGRSLGTEPVLLDRYGVSRAVFRESVRLLEHHSVVRFRAGSNGGLVVDEPNVNALVEAMTGFLLFHAAAERHVSSIRLVLERHAAECATRRGPSAGTSRLVRHLERHRPAGASQCTSEFHVELGNLAGNRAIAVLLRALIEVQRSGALTDASAAPTDGESHFAQHSAILESLLRGDVAATVEQLSAHLGEPH